MKVRIGMVAAALALGGVVAGCGDSEDTTKAETTEQVERNLTPQEAIVEVATVRNGLAGALTTYKLGDHAEADKQVGDTYLEHFELVEGPLGKVDHELTEKLEDGMREELRDLMKADAADDKVAALVMQLDGDLAKAQEKLRG